MKKILKINYHLILISFLLGTLAFSPGVAGSTEVKKESEPKDKKVVARVNGQPVFEDQLNPGVDKSLKKWKKYGMKKQTPELTLRLQKRALNKVIDEELVAQASMKTKVTDLDKKVSGKLQKMKRKYKTPEQFEDHLKRQNITLKKLKENLAQQVHIDEYLKEQGITDPEIPEEKIRGFYEDNPENYERKEAVKVFHILIKVEANTGPEEKEKAYLKAEEIRKEILEGKSFDLMAKEHSQCNSASGGGGLGYIERGYMPKEFDEVAFTMEKGSVSEVVETKFGYHIIKITNKSEAGVAPYEEVRDFIKKYLQEGESKNKLAEHIAQLREKAKIEILLEEPEKKE